MFAKIQQSSENSNIIHQEPLEQIEKTTKKNIKSNTNTQNIVIQYLQSLPETQPSISDNISTVTTSEFSGKNREYSYLNLII